MRISVKKVEGRDEGTECQEDDDDAVPAEEARHGPERSSAGGLTPAGYV